MKIRKQMGALCIALVTMAFLPLSAVAQETDKTVKFSHDTEIQLQQKLDSIVQERNLSVSFSNIVVEANKKTVDLYQENAEKYATDILSLYERDRGVKNPSLHHVLAAKPRKYTSSVFSGVPAVGVCNVHQDFEATVSNYKITSKKLLGSSYQDGVCVFQWTPNYSWFTGNLDVHSKGTFSAFVKGSSVSFTATFKAVFHVNKDSLWQEKQ